MGKKGGKQFVKGAKLWSGAIAAAFLAAAAMYFALLQVEKNILSGYEKERIYLAKTEIQAGEIIRADNAELFFEAAEVDAKMVPKNAVTDLGEIEELEVIGKIDQGSPLTAGMFRKIETVLMGMEEPVIAGFYANDLYQVVGGVLRTGDLIHIYCTEEDMGTFLIWENVYVQQVFDSSGSAIENIDKDTAAQMINIYLDKEDVERFYTRLEKGSLRVVKKRN